MDKDKNKSFEISVVMTTYNGSKFVLEQLESFRQQSRRIDELLIFDDQSTDGKTIDIIKKFLHDCNEENWKLFVNERNLGWRKNFIQGIEKAKGKYIFLADQDDIWAPKKIEKMHEIMSQNSSINLLCCNYDILIQTRSKQRTNSTQLIHNTGELEKVPFTKKFHLVGRPGCSYCVRREFAQKAIQAWEEGYAHDKLLWNAAMLSGGLFRINLPLITFRRHGENASGRGPTKNRAGRLATHKLDMRVYEKLKRIFNDDILNQKNEIQKNILTEYEKWLITREGFLKKKQIFGMFHIIHFSNFYSSWKSVVADIIVK